MIDEGQSKRDWDEREKKRRLGRRLSWRNKNGCGAGGVRSLHACQMPYLRLTGQASSPTSKTA